MLNNRFTIELCENVHLHYRNLWLEFTKEEFLILLEEFQKVNPDEVKNFNFSDYAFKVISHRTDLPAETYFDNRLQIEKQVEGHYHIHYRNLRVELKKLCHFGYSKFSFCIQNAIFYAKSIFYGLEIFIISNFFTKKQGINIINNTKLNISSPYKENIINSSYYYYTTKKIKLKNLRISLFCKEGMMSTIIPHSPAYKYLNGDVQSYSDYNLFKSCRQKCNVNNNHNVQRYSDLIESLVENNFKLNDLIIIKSKNNQIIDGQHRACILYYNKGGDYEVKILKIWFEKDCNEFIIKNVFLRSFLYLRKKSFFLSMLYNKFFPNFVFNKKDDRLIFTGFSNFENWGVWTDANIREVASIEFYLHFSQSYLYLNFTVRPNSQKQDVIVFLNGKQIDIWTFENNNDKQFNIKVGREDISKQKCIKLSFKVDNIKSPYDLKGSYDKRKIGLGFINMRIHKH